MTKYLLLALALMTLPIAYYRHEAHAYKHKYEVERGAKFELARRLATALASRQEVADWNVTEATTTAHQCADSIRAAVAGVRVKPVTIAPIPKESTNATNTCPTFTCPDMYRLRDIQAATGSK